MILQMTTEIKRHKKEAKYPQKMLQNDKKKACVKQMNENWLWLHHDEESTQRSL